MTLLAAGCASHTAAEINEEFREIIERRNSQYTLKDGDQLQIDLYDVEGGLSQTALILPDGRTDLFFLPDHRAAGKSVQEFSADFTRGIEKEIRGAEVSVQVTPREEQVHLVGTKRWEKPGSYPLTTRMTLRDAIAVAGGDTIYGRPWKMLLTRPYLNPLKPKRYYVSIWDEDEEIFLLPGDIIENDFNIVYLTIQVIREYVLGWIPGSNQLLGGATAAAF